MSSSQQNIAGKGNSNSPKRFKYSLSSTDYGLRTLKHVPGGWENAELTFIRDPKYKGVLTTFSTSELTFYKEARDYIQTAYEAKGIDYEIVVRIWLFSPSQMKFVSYFTGKIDLSTYSIDDIGVSCEIIATGFQNVVLNRDDVPVDMMSTKFIGGGENSMEALNTVWERVTIPEYTATQNADWRFNGQAVGVSNYAHFLPMTNFFNEYGSSEVNDQEFDSIVKFFVPADSFSGNIKGDLKVIVAGSGSYNVEIYLRIKTSGGAISTVESYLTSGVDNIEHTFTVDEAIGLGPLDSLYFEGFLDGNTATLTYSASSVSIFKSIGSALPEISNPMFYIYEAFSRTISLLSGQSHSLVSDLLGRTDSVPESYSEDGEGSLTTITVGRWLRGFDPNLVGLNFKLSELFAATNAMQNIGMGFEVFDGLDKVRLEKESYFFDISDNPNFPDTDSRPYITTQILDLSDVVTEAKIKKDVLPEWYANQVKGGYGKFEYEVVQGLKEFNTESLWATPIKSVKDTLDISSPYRADTQGVNKLREKPYADDPTEDVNGDNDIFIFDVKRGGSFVFTVKTDEDFSLVSGGIDPGSSYNLNYTPRRNFERHDNRIRSMRLALGDEVQFMKTDKNNKLVTQLTTESEPKAESADLLVNNMTPGYWIPEAYIFEAPVNEDTIAAIQANPYGVIKIASDKWGWILEVQTNNEKNVGQFKLLRVDTGNANAIVIVSVKYGYLYNRYTIFDPRELTSNSDWSVPSKTVVDNLSTYLGGNSVAGGKMKDEGFTYWDSPNTGATDEVGFNARGAGRRLSTNGNFVGLNTAFLLWTTAASAGLRGISNTSTALGSGTITNDTDGASIRLIKDAAGVADGETTIYFGNDGTNYLAIAINELYWTVCNLAETRYRNGDDIPTETDGTTWAGLTTGAKCAFNNDESNVLI